MDGGVGGEEGDAEEDGSGEKVLGSRKAATATAVRRAAAGASTGTG